MLSGSGYLHSSQTALTYLAIVQSITKECADSTQTILRAFVKMATRSGLGTKLDRGRASDQIYTSNVYQDSVIPQRLLFTGTNFNEFSE